MILSANDISCFLHGGIVYAITTVLCFYSLCICLWWWYKSGEVPFFFIHNTILLTAITLFTSTSTFLFSLKVLGIDYDWVLEAWWWLSRPYAFLIPMIVFALELTRRVFYVRRRLFKRNQYFEENKEN